ncbi:putative FAD-dependent isoamyl alcohol oxidase [Xylaria curta]|nr:putative FAD-dependent isoamyl alcohol oxidase [Xylaria curta]
MVQGQFIATVPQASVCRSSPYSNYNCCLTQLLCSVTKSAEIMNSYYQNQPCDPFITRKPYELGNYAVYSGNFIGKDNVLVAMTFAKEKNIRLDIESTGHDYNCKSTEMNALSLWMHNLQTLQIIEAYQGDTYSGPAVKVGPGIIAGEAYETIVAAGYRIMGGEYASVSLTGGGTYAMILSMTTKIYPDGPIASGALSFNLTDSPNESVTERPTYKESKLWEAIGLFLQQMPSLVSDRNTLQLRMGNNVFDAFGITMPDVHVSAVQALVAPYLIQIKRLVPLSAVLNSTTTGQLMDAFKPAVADGTFLIGYNGLSVAEDACSLAAFWDYEAALEENLAVKETLVSIYALPTVAVTPGSSVYLNEVSYDRLSDIKHKYDPNFLLQGQFAVGGDEFMVDRDGRLCVV